MATIHANSGVQHTKALGGKNVGAKAQPRTPDMAAVYADAEILANKQKAAPRAATPTGTPDNTVNKLPAGFRPGVKDAIDQGVRKMMAASPGHLPGEADKFVGLVNQSGNLASMDINALVQYVLRQASLESNKDLQFYASKVKFFNDLKERIRDTITELRGSVEQVKEYEAKALEMEAIQTQIQTTQAEHDRENSREVGDAWFNAESRTLVSNDTTQQQTVIGTRNTPGDPLIIDLDGDGIETRDDVAVGEGFLLDSQTDVEVNTATREFETSDDGLHFRTVRETATTTTRRTDETRFTEWVGADDGLLVMDRNGDGQIQAADLFGDASVTGRAGTNGFEDLKALDSNHDGILNKQDEAFAELRVWRDADGNGVVGAGEMLSMAEAGVAEIRLDYKDEGEGLVRQTGTFKSERAVELEASLEDLHGRRDDLAATLSTMAAGLPRDMDIDMRPVPGPDGTVRLPSAAITGGPVETSAKLDELIKKFEQKLNSAGDDAQLANIDLQNMLQKQQQMLQTMSNVSKMTHDSLMAVVRKIG